MVTKMKTNEMKQKNEEILKRWRTIGFLVGLKEGSINEWRCAKSFDNMANYIQNNNIESKAIMTLSFPLIRRALCTGKKRLHRIITPEEIYNFFYTYTPKDCMEIAYKPKTKLGIKLRKVYENFLEYNGNGDNVLADFFDKMYKNEGEYEIFNAIMYGVYDREAEMLAMATDLFVLKNQTLD